MKITKANGVVEYQLLAQLKQRAGETVIGGVAKSSPP